MNLRPIALLVALQVALLLLGLGSPLSLISPAFVLGSVRDFESVAARLSRKGRTALAPATITGKSGVRHEFAFAVLDESKKPLVVVDTELSVKEVDEMKVLKFYVKVFDVGPAKAVLCVSPKLGERAGMLAKEYGITVLEDEVPRQLISKADQAVKGLLETGDG